jgi:hydroxymethylpyrimidine pyrophosphatase-like HAD family hydrolase
VFDCSKVSNHTEALRGDRSSLAVSAPSIIGGGALIIDPVREEILWQVTIDRQTARQVIAAAQQHPYLVAFATDLTVTDPKLPKDIDIADDLNTLYIADIATNDMAEFLATELRQIVGITVTKAHSPWMNSKQPPIKSSPA